MSSTHSESAIPFQIDDWLIDKSNPSQRGQYTGKNSKAGPRTMIEIRYPDGSRRRRPMDQLELVSSAASDSIEERLSAGRFGKIRDLQRLITFQKLKGTLHEVVYSMEAAQIDFYPYQFKPVMKFINSPTERLIIADEVGLGKTIESALVWMELQARKNARRLLVVCPKILTEKWRDELRSKFLVDARIVDFKELRHEVSELQKVGPTHSFVLIASYTGLRPPKKELKWLSSTSENTGASEKTTFLQDITNWQHTYSPFDLVIFDEAHYMRNAGTTTFHLGKSLVSHNETAVLCVSATPVNNSNKDLHSLLRLIDGDFFETQGMFNELLDINRPTIRAINTLSRPKISWENMEESVSGMAQSDFIKNSPLFRLLCIYLERLQEDPENRALLAKTQDTAEKLNLLGNYINRTRRVQVDAGRAVRRPIVLAVEYTDKEMLLYRSILELVRRQCKKDSKPFHVFQSLGLQLRSASCLPAIAADIRAGKLKGGVGSVEQMADLFAESVGEDVYDGYESLFPEEDEFADVDFEALMAYDFEQNDQKFNSLLALLDGVSGNSKGDDHVNADEKVVIFAYYRPTLAYLHRRLLAEGYSVAQIHGGIDHEDRWVELDKFKNPSGPRILLSSEVGSEGIDLQFCRIVVNYDLPWNPMRVEQRIGRIDRVGQNAKSLLIVNFKVKDTVEERLYDRLHSKLLIFANSLGDLESVIGSEVHNLTVDLLSRDLTKGEEQERMEQAERVIATRARQIEELEKSGDSLVALNDYVQKKVCADKEKGRYILPEELEDYIRDFFERDFEGTEISYNTPANGCMQIRLSSDAKSSLMDFIKNDHSLSTRPLRKKELTITFQREIHAALPATQRNTVAFMNHLSPFIRWITERNDKQAHVFYNVSALQLRYDELPPGDYCYRIERWTFKGLSIRENMAFSVIHLQNGTLLDADLSENIMQVVLRKSSNWDYVDCDSEVLLAAHQQLERALESRFSDAYEAFSAENTTTMQIRVRRAVNHWDRLITQSKKAIYTLKENNRPESLIRGRETRLRNELQNKADRVEILQACGEVDPDSNEVAAGVFRIIT